MAIKTGNFICPNCENSRQLWNGEEFEECPYCESVEAELDSIVDIQDVDFREIDPDDEDFEFGGLGK
jgi:hypothetical protein